MKMNTKPKRKLKPSTLTRIYLDDLPKLAALAALEDRTRVEQLGIEIRRAYREYTYNKYVAHQK